MDNDPNIPKWVWAAILGVAVTVACLKQADAAENTNAPIVRPVENSTVMVQTGWYTYKRSPDGVVLYCVEQTDTLLTCVVYVVVPNVGAGVTIVPDIQRTVVGS